MPRIDPRLVDRLYRQADAARWHVPAESFAEALDRSATKRFGGQSASANELESYLTALHLSDLAIACACAAGHEGAWEVFVLQFRPGLYRAADAIDPSGSAREVADSLYADLFGLRGSGGDRQSLFRYFHGRSGLATWLRAVLVQRHVDAIRARRRVAPLPEDEAHQPAMARADEPAVDRPRLFEALRRVLAAAVQTLEPRDRLRLSCYYAQQMTLAEIGRLLGEHEATVSRNLARTRRAIRSEIEQRLRDEERMSETEMTECFATAMHDSGTLDLKTLLDSSDRKNPVAERSTSEGMP